MDTTTTAGESSPLAKPPLKTHLYDVSDILERVSDFPGPPIRVRSHKGTGSDIDPGLDKLLDAAIPYAQPFQFAPPFGDGEDLARQPHSIPNAPTLALDKAGQTRSSSPVDPIESERVRELAMRALDELPPADELWIIVQPDGEDRSGSAGLGSGSLLLTDPNGDPIPVPLVHTDVSGSIRGPVQSVRVTQIYENPSDLALDARYLFPLPHRAAVHDFVLTVGDRVVRGVVRPLEEAREIFDVARSQGRTSSLLTQERPNMFVQEIANLAPRSRVEVEIAYSGVIDYRAGAYELVFPMVAGLRFSPEGTEAPPKTAYRSGSRCGHDIALSLEIDLGIPLKSVRSPSHAIVVEGTETTRITVELSAKDVIPDRDFVLRLEAASEVVTSSMITHRDRNGGTFGLLLIPPTQPNPEFRRPIELIFVLDCSGSMRGEPLRLAKTAIESALDQLQPGDTFQILRFSDRCSALGDAPLAVTQETITDGKAHLATLSGSGGTQMIEGIRSALDFPSNGARQRIVSFMTDGQIGNEAQIFSEVVQRRRDARLFSFGVGSAPNRHLLNGLARFGHGAVAYVSDDQGAVAAATEFYETLAHPAVVDTAIDWGSLAPLEIYPRKTPDLFVGRPVFLAGRFIGEPPSELRISGRRGGQPVAIPVQVVRDDEASQLPWLWARRKIASLADQLPIVPDDSRAIRAEIETTALEYGLLSSETSFVAVDSVTSAPDGGTLFVVPAAAPAEATGRR
ncbi:MAG: VIT domain-containing protein [Planctomycetota bacterium]